VCEFGSSSAGDRSTFNYSEKRLSADRSSRVTADGPQYSITAHSQPVIKKSQRVASQCGATGPEIKRASAVSRGPATLVTISGALSLWRPRAFALSLACAISTLYLGAIDLLARTSQLECWSLARSRSAGMKNVPFINIAPSAAPT